MAIGSRRLRRAEQLDSLAGEMSRVMGVVDADDLEAQCYVCCGSGWVKEPPACAAEAGAGAASEHALARRRHESEADVVCAKCEGRGTLLTAVGKQLVGILRRYL